MPRRCPTDARLPGLLDAQDQVVSREQAMALGLTRRAIDRLLRDGRWQLLLPSVYLTHRGEAARRQRLVAALLFAGPDAAIDAADACRYHGLRSVPVDDDRVQVVAPWGTPARSRGFVVVRRTCTPLRVLRTATLRYVDPATAVVAATRGMASQRAVLAAFSEVLQRRLTSYDALVRAHVQGPPRNVRLGDVALEAVGAGIRSAPEDDFRTLVAASLVLPAPLYNPLLRLPDGRLACVDALFADAALVHETNGRSAHERADLFADLQARHDALTAAGLTVLHNPPRRLVADGRRALAEVERCYARLAGCGLPPGVAIVRSAA